MNNADLACGHQRIELFLHLTTNSCMSLLLNLTQFNKYLRLESIAFHVVMSYRILRTLKITCDLFACFVSEETKLVSTSTTIYTP